MYNKYLVLIQTCSRTIVDLKINPFEIKIVSYVNILHVFLFTRKICENCMYLTVLPNE